MPIEDGKDGSRPEVTSPTGPLSLTRRALLRAGALGAAGVAAASGAALGLRREQEAAGGAAAGDPPIDHAHALGTVGEVDKIGRAHV